MRNLPDILIYNPRFNRGSIDRVMIDTIRFKIKISQDVFMKLKKQSVETLKINHKDSRYIVRYWNVTQNLPSYQRDINIFLNELDQENVYIEFSLPKMYYDHNIFMVYPEQILGILNRLRFELTKNFAGFPLVSKWEIQRLDLCYNWKFATQNEAEKLLSVIRKFKYPRKKVYRYDTSIMYKGSSYTVKYYLKKQEFFANDFKKLCRDGKLDQAYQYLTYAEGVLRFEVTMRKASLVQYFHKKHILVSDLIDFDIEKLLQFFFHKSMEFKSTISSRDEVLEKLKNVYSPIKAIDLYLFYVATITSSPEEKLEIYASFADRTLRQKKSDLKKAGVGVVVPDVFSFDLSIPSVNCSNPPPTLVDGL